VQLHRRKLVEDLSKRPLGGFWTEPLARGVALGSSEAGRAERHILCAKPSLRMIYQDIYRTMLDTAERYVEADEGCRIEVGSGGGFSMKSTRRSSRVMFARWKAPTLSSTPVQCLFRTDR
jgi:hypothetical protein